MMAQKELNALEVFNAFLDENGARLNQKLGEFNEGILEGAPKFFEQNMEYFTNLNSGGKMLRAVLVNMGYYIMGGKDIHYSDELALSLEVFQSSILIHDDLLDHGATRRGKDTVHIRIMHDFHISNKEILDRNPDVLKDFTNGFAVALGYMGVYMAYEKLVAAYGDDKNLIRILHEYNDMVIKTVEGGIMDVVVPFQEKYQQYLPVSSAENVDPFEVVEQLALLKTAYYTTMGPLILGMMLGDAGELAISDVSDIMKDVGLAFQIQDDILGIYADAVELGKDVGADVTEYKPTFLYTYTKVRSPETLPELNKYYGKEGITVEELEAVRELFKNNGAYDFTYNKMVHHYTRAKEKLASLDYMSDEGKALILGYIEYLEARRK